MKFRQILLVLLLPAFYFLPTVKTVQAQKQSDSVRVNQILAAFNKNYYANSDSAISSFKLLFEAYSLSLKSNYPEGQINSTYYIAEMYNSIANSAKAIEYYYKSLKTAELHNKREIISKIYRGVGLVYYNQKDWENANRFFSNSLRLKVELGNLKSASTDIYLIGICKNYLKEYTDSKKWLDSALAMKRKYNNVPQSINEAYTALAELYKNTKQYDSALYYYKKVEPFFESTQEPTALSIIYRSVAEIYFDKNDLSRALKYGLKAKEQSPKVFIVEFNARVDDILYKIHNARKNYRQALHHLNNYRMAQDSIMRHDIVTQINKVQLGYELEKQESAMLQNQRIMEDKFNTELKEQERKRNLIALVALVCVIVIIIVGISYRLVSKEKKESEKLLLNILPKETVQELKKFGRAIPKRHPDVSIMFCDIKDFTHIAEGLQPEELVETLDFYFKSFDEVMARYNIEKIKTIGDAYMCVAGLNGQKSAQEEALNMLNAASDIAGLSTQVHEQFKNRYGLSLNFRIGVHTGSVISGVVGLHKYAYDIWGDAVNVAARMEQNSESGRINISGNTHELVKADFECQYRGKISAKNKGEIDMYFALKKLV